MGRDVDGERRVDRRSAADGILDALDGAGELRPGRWTPEPVPAGEVLSLDRDGGRTRRSFLRAVGTVGAVGAAGGGLAGLRAAVERAVGRSVDGDPVIWTRDGAGVPDRVRVLEPERRRRLAAYARLDVPALVAARDRVAGVTLAERDGDLHLVALVDGDPGAVEPGLPDRLAGLPVATRGAATGFEPARVCDRRELAFYDPLVAGVAVYGRDADGRRMPSGTLGLVCWDGDGRCLVTAAHVAERDDEYADRLYQDGRVRDGYREQAVARHAVHSGTGGGGLDVARYRLLDGVRATPLETVDDDRPPVAGAWTFAGLADATTGGEVPVSFAGRSTCYAEAAAVRTWRTDLVDYGAVVRPPVATDGDSGGAFLDDRGYLVATFSFYSPGHNLGPVGGPLLDRVGARLQPPDGADRRGRGHTLTPER